MLERQNWMKYAPEMMVEWRQMMEEGKDAGAFEERCRELAERSGECDCEKEALELGAQMAAAPLRDDYIYEEPSDYESIRQAARGSEETEWRKILSEDALREKISGAWIGRISGCLLGKPMECLKSNVIEMILKGSGNYPMERYVDSRDFSEGLYEKAGIDKFFSWQKCWIDRIGGKAPVDDDTNYTVLAMKLIEEYGTDFEPNDVLEAWAYWMPLFSACTAERVAYRNAAAGMYAPETASHANPYREWIGAQIRGDFFGYINPGRWKRAASLAWKDASISHVKNGIYGEMFAAAMISAAAVYEDMEQIIETGLNEIPEKSRLAEDVGHVLEWYRSGVPQEEAFGRIHEQYDEYSQHDWCHTNSNAMIVAASLLYGEKDFGRTVCMAVQTGFDTDCNAATAGSVLGMLIGEKKIPLCWPEGFQKTLRTTIAGYHEVTVEQLVDKTMELLFRYE